MEELDYNVLSQIRALSKRENAKQMISQIEFDMTMTSVKLIDTHSVIDGYVSVLDMVDTTTKLHMVDVIDKLIDESKILRNDYDNMSVNRQNWIEDRDKYDAIYKGEKIDLEW